jgi:hypothetical protein
MCYLCDQLAKSRFMHTLCQRLAIEDSFWLVVVISSFRVRRSMSLLDPIGFFFLHVYSHLSGLPHCHWKLHAPVIHLPKISLGHYLVDWYLADRQLVNITKDGRQGCFQWTHMAHGGSSEFQSLFLFISFELWSSSLINIINFWFWALAFIQIFSSRWPR